MNRAVAVGRGPYVGEHAFIFAVIFVAVVVGVALAIEPILALVPVAGLMSVWLLVDGRARVGFILFGGLFVFQQSQDLDVSKLAFLALFVVAFVGALLDVRGLSQTEAYRRARPLMSASIALVVIAVVSAGVAYTHHTPLASAWLRDVAPYLLFAAVPVLALDAQASLSRRGLLAFVIVAGGVGGLAFAVEWLDRRGIAEFQAESFGLASQFLAAAVFAYGMSAALQAGQRRWLIASGLALAMLLVTGTRTNLALLVAPLVIVVGARRLRMRRLIRLVFVAPVAIAITLVCVVVVLWAVDADQEQLFDRVTLSQSSGTAIDQSYVERVRQLHAAWDVFADNPILGAGPGTAFEWREFDGRLVSGYVLDSTVTLPAKFGVVGVLAILWVLYAYWLLIRSLRAYRDPTVAELALIGYFGVMLATIPFYTPFEDKGFALGLMLLLALVLQETNESPSARFTLHRSLPDEPRLAPHPGPARFPRSPSRRAPGSTYASGR
jgi:O-antigen ligase